MIRTYKFIVSFMQGPEYVENSFHIFQAYILYIAWQDKSLFSLFRKALLALIVCKMIPSQHLQL